MLSRPSECVALTNFFLQRKEIDPAKLVNSRQDFDHQEMTKRYRTREQSQAAWQIQALCQANEGLLLPADVSINRAIQLAKQYRQTDIEAASLMIKAKLALAQQEPAQAATLLADAGRQLTDKSPRHLQESLALLQASTLLHQHKSDEARLAFEQIRRQAQENNQPVQQAWANYLLADYYQRLQQDELALSHYIETLNLLGKRQQFYLKAMAAEQAANINADLGAGDQAIHYANMATSEFELLGNPSLLISSLLNLGRVTRTGSHDASLALVYFFNALDLAKTLADADHVAQLYLEIGHSYRVLQVYSEAQHYLSLARAGFERSQNMPRQIDTLLQLGQLYVAQEEHSLALTEFEQALALAKQLNDVPRLIECHRLLAQFFEYSDQPAQALAHHKAYHGYYAQASQLNRMLTQSLVQDSDQQLQQERELAGLQQNNQQIQQEKQHFATLAVSLSLVVPLLLYGWLRNQIRSRRLQQHNLELQHSLLLESRTGLPNWRQLMHRLPQEMAKSQLRSEQWYLNEAEAQPFNDKIYYLLLHVPFMVDLSERLGLMHATALQKELGTYLQGRIHPEARLYDLREGQFMYVISQRQVNSLQHTITSLERMFAEFPSPFRLDQRLAIGIIGHPFLPREPRALDDMRLGDILYLAMAAAHQLADQTGEKAWVELLAVDCQQAAFFHGDIRHCCIQAILKGLVKVNSSHKKQHIDWHALAPELVMPI
ncbi:GGDEF domain-containing protein [Oceanisphaera sp.]|uniref:GGDEF domain-containing protein n=1 Tax=Oceanisphaera sp. TaxID=1929979 RepID=UPI003A937F4A